MTQAQLGRQLHLDATFGSGGFAIASPAAVVGLEYANVGLAQVTGGRLIAGGTGLIGETDHFYLTGHAPDGGLDASFGHNGEVVSSIEARGWALAVQPASRAPHPLGRPTGEMVLIGGQAYDPATGNLVFAVQRYTLAGRLDTSFGSGGTVLQDLAPINGPADSDEEWCWALAIQPGVGILGAGYAVKPDGSRGAMARWHFDGRLDTTFNGRHGRLIYPALDAPADPNGMVTNTAFTCIAMQENGRILVGGTYGAQFLVARLMPDGSLDPSFGQGGLVFLTLGLGLAGIPTLRVQPDGRIVLMASVGAVTGPGPDDFASGIGVARLLPNGDLDPTFGRLVTTNFGPPFNRPGGRVTYRLGWNIEVLSAPGSDNGVNDAVLQPGAREGIIGVGGTKNLSAFQGDFLVARFLADGDVDTLSTGPAGAVESPVPGGGGQISTAVYNEDAHALTVAGGVYSEGRTGIGLARYLLPA